MTDLVNAALLGTDRRPVEGSLLEEAARRRAGRLVAGATTVVRPADPAPADDRPLPGATARAVLDDLLLHGADGLVDLWLGEALDAGVAVAPEHWMLLLDRTRRSTVLDRRRVATALGPRGLWFARHNPAWSAVVRAAGSEPSRERVPTVADLAALTRDTPDGAARTLGRQAGAALPLGAYGAVAAAARTAAGPTAQLALAVAEEVLWARWALAPAFDPTRVPPDRAPTSQERP